MKRIATVFTIVAFMGLVACGGAEKKESNMEAEANEMMDEMGEDVEEAANETEEAMEEAADETEKAAGEAGDAMEAVADSTKAAAEEMTDGDGEM